MEFCFQMQPEYTLQPLEPSIEKIMSLTSEPYDDGYVQTIDLEEKSMQIEQQKQEELVTQTSRPLFKMVPARSTLPIEVQLNQLKFPPTDKCKDYPKYMLSRIVDMLYSRTNIQDKIQRRKSVLNFSNEQKIILTQDERSLCFNFLQEYKLSHNFVNIRFLFGANPQRNAQNKTADVFRLQSYKYFSSDRAAFDYVNGQMHFSNKLSVIRRLQKMCDMCIDPFDVMSLGK